MAPLHQVGMRRAVAGIQAAGGENALEKEMATYSSILAWKNPLDREAWWATVHGVADLDTTEVT